MDEDTLQRKEREASRTGVSEAHPAPLPPCYPRPCARPAPAPPHLPPLGALVEGAQQLGHSGGGEVQHRLAAELLDLSQGGDRVGDDHGVGIHQQVLEHVEEAAVLHQLAADVVQLGHAHRRRLAHVRVLVLQRGRWGAV